MRKMRKSDQHRRLQSEPRRFGDYSYQIASWRIAREGLLSSRHSTVRLAGSCQMGRLVSRQLTIALRLFASLAALPFQKSAQFVEEASTFGDATRPLVWVTNRPCTTAPKPSR